MQSEQRTQLVILGAGTAGTILANRLVKRLDMNDYKVTVIDQHSKHYYQPGFLFIPFGIYDESHVVKDRTGFLHKQVEYIQTGIERVDSDESLVFVENGSSIPYDHLIIATGADIAPEEIEGMTSDLWHRDIFDFYTLEGAVALAERLADWKGGRMVVHLSELPIKCPVAPIEFTLLVDAWLKERNLREETELIYVTPLDSVFTKPSVSTVLGDLFSKRDIGIVTEFAISEVDVDTRSIRSWDEREVPFDLLVTTPPNMGASFIEKSGIGDDLNYVHVDKNTLRSLDSDNIWVVGDAGNFPTSKAGSVVHFQIEVLEENLLQVLNGEEPTHNYDGRANCFIETGNGKAIMIDFNYENDPVPGNFPLRVLGPLSQLKETRLNHWSKLMFKWVYWHLLLTGMDIPVPQNKANSITEVEESLNVSEV